MKRKIVFENGREFTGLAFGSKNDVVSEVIFETSMVGYQEILSDPVYTDLSIVMTYPLIGNYGIIEDDFDSKIIGIKALIMKEYNDKPSNFRYANTLSQVLEENDVVGITHVDTRAITRMLVREGTMRAYICSEKTPKSKAIKAIKAHKENKNMISRVSCENIWYSRCSKPQYNIVAIDTGITTHNLQDFKKFKTNVTIVPYNYDVDQILELKPQAVFIPNGPGSPKNAKKVISTVSKLMGKIPLFGIGLGMDVIALAAGLDVKKMKVGHHGSNHSIRNLATDKLNIANQNHSYTIKEFKKRNIAVTHRNVIDNTIEGIDIPAKRAFGLAFYPNSDVDPQNSQEIMDKLFSYINNK